MPNVLDGRSVSEQLNERIDAPCVVGTILESVERRTETVVRQKREREARGRNAARVHHRLVNICGQKSARLGERSRLPKEASKKTKQRTSL